MKSAILGYLVESHTKMGLVGFKVEVWSEQDQFVGAVTTGAMGEFLVELDESYLQLLLKDIGTDLYFKVFDRDRLIKSTRNLLHWNVQGGPPLIVLKVEVEPPVDAAYLYRLTIEQSISLHTEPTLQSPILREFRSGHQIDVLDAESGWLFVQSVGQQQQGWVSTELLRGITRAENEFTQMLSEPLLDANALAELEEGLTLLDRLGDEQGMRYREALEPFRRQAEFLDHLSRDAAGFLAGDPNAEDRFQSLISYFLERQAFAPTPMSAPYPANAMAPARFTDLPTPREPSFPGLPTRHPCLINPGSFARINAAVIRLAVMSERENPMIDRYRQVTLASALQIVMRPAIQLETLHEAAKAALHGGTPFIERFQTVLDHVLHDHGAATDLPAWLRPQDAEPTSGQFPAPWPAGGGSGDDWVFNACQHERAGRTARVIRCACGERYEIEDIVTLDRALPDGEPYHREGCPGEWVEIRGDGFGDSRYWGIGERQSEVIFSGRGREGVSPDNEDYRLWKNSRVQVRVPEGAVTGRLSMRILCRRTLSGRLLDVSRCGVQLRGAAGRPENRHFEVPTAPDIKRFRVTSPEWEAAVSRLEATSCTEVSLQVRAVNAEQAVILNSRGERIEFPEGEPGERRVIEGTVTVSDHEDQVYTLRATNACAETVDTVEVTWLTRIVLETEPGEVRAGSSFELRIRHPCSPELLGFDSAVLQLSAEGVGGTLTGLPDVVRFEGAETEKLFTIETQAESCGGITIRAEVVEHTEAYDETTRTTNVAVWDRPVITEIRTGGANTCDDFRFEIVGHCFNAGYPRERNVVELHISADGREYTKRAGAYGGSFFIDEFQPGPEHPFRDAKLICVVRGPLRDLLGIDSLGPYTVSVTVEHFGMSSESHPLLPGGDELSAPQPVIESFKTSHFEIEHGVPTDVTIRWRVRYAKRIELESIVGGRRWVEPGVLREEDYASRPCVVRDGDYDDRISVRSVYELRAFPIGGGSVVRETVQVTVRGEPPKPIDPVGTRRLIIYNCDRNRHTIYVWTFNHSDPLTRWENHGSLEHGYNEWGTCRPPAGDADSIELTFSDGNIYEVRIVDPELPTCGGRNDPRVRNCYVGRDIILGDEDGIERSHFVV